MLVWCPDWPVVAAEIVDGVAASGPVAVLHANRVVASSPAARAEGELLITTIVREILAEPMPPLELPGTKHLSPREREVVQHLLRGRRSKEIAMLLDVSEKTIWTHRARAFQKLALRGVGDLFRVAYDDVSERRRLGG